MGSEGVGLWVPFEITVTLFSKSMKQTYEKLVWEFLRVSVTETMLPVPVRNVLAVLMVDWLSSGCASSRNMWARATALPYCCEMTFLMSTGVRLEVSMVTGGMTRGSRLGLRKA